MRQIIWYTSNAELLAEESKHINNMMVKETLTHTPEHASYFHLQSSANDDLLIKAESFYACRFL